MFGLTIEEASGPPVEVWPCAWPAVQAFGRLLTQWRVGMSGATGLDYAAVPVVFEMVGIDRAKWPDTFDDLRAMESAALQKMSEDRAANERQRAKRG